MTLTPTGIERANPIDATRLRADFPILDTVLHAAANRPGVPLAYLDNAASTHRPRQVMAAMRDVDEHHYANVHRGIHSLSEQCTERYEAARDKVRQFIHASQREE